MDFSQSNSRNGTLTRIGVRDAVAARYPEMFATGLHSSRPDVQRKVRLHSGLVIVTALHGALNADEAHAIAEFRLHQYTLAKLYSAEKVERLGLEIDPAMQMLAHRDIHIAVGDTEGHFLCYVSMQSPLGSKHNPSPVTTGALIYPYLRDTDRPLFPCESEYGTYIYATHPGLMAVPLVGVREITRLVRNQAYRTPLDVLALAEAVSAMAQVIANRRHRMEVLVGCAAPEVRKMLFNFGVPIAYAPYAPVIAENQGGSVGSEPLWTDEAAVPGRFWPFVLSAADVRLDIDYFNRLDEVLGYPPHEARDELSQLRRHSLLRTPRYTIAPHETGGTLWTGDPFHR